jgi:hypothetical protein
MQAAMKSHSSVAITGSAYRFPGDARSHESYWALLDSGRSVIRNTPVDRFDIEPFFNQDGGVPGTTYARGGGYVDGAFEFDHSFFRISRAEALSTDPHFQWIVNSAGCLNCAGRHSRTQALHPAQFADGASACLSAAAKSIMDAARCGPAI